MKRKKATMDENMKRMFGSITENTQKQLNEQAKKHAEQLAEMKQTTMEAHNLLTHKYMATPSTHDHKAYAHFTAMNKAYNILFYGQP
jgi:pyruvoyl-dependent arginine decarboxylase (PvlArgDC)